MSARSRWPAALTAAIGALVLLTALSVGSVMVVYSWPHTSYPAAPKGEVVVVLGAPLASISPGDAVRFDAPDGAVFIINGGGTSAVLKTTKTGWLANTSSGLLALDATSSDDGCPVHFDPAAHRFESPCHGSIYALDGRVLRGPAVAPLSHLAFRELDANRIAVVGSLA